MMITLGDMIRDGFSTVPGALFTALITWAIGAAVFRGFFAREWLLRFDRKHAKDLGRLHVAQAELRANREIVNSPDGRALTEDERAARRLAVANSLRATFWVRAVRHGADCQFCHTFWAGLALGALALFLRHDVLDAWRCFDWVATALGYAAFGSRFLAIGQPAKAGGCGR